MLVETDKGRAPSTFAWRQGCGRCGGVELVLPHPSRELWSAWNHAWENRFTSRVQIAGGEDRNGIELWRRLSMVNVGGAEQVAVAGLRGLYKFAKCPAKDKLNTWQGEWTHLRGRYGGNINGTSLCAMILNIRPGGCSPRGQREETRTADKSAGDRRPPRRTRPIHGGPATRASSAA